MVHRAQMREFHPPMRGHEEGMQWLATQAVNQGVTRRRFFEACVKQCQLQEGRNHADAINRARELTREFFDPAFQAHQLNRSKQRKIKRLKKPVRRLIAH